MSVMRLYYYDTHVFLIGAIIFLSITAVIAVVTALFTTTLVMAHNDVKAHFSRQICFSSFWRLWQ